MTADGRHGDAVQISRGALVTFGGLLAKSFGRISFLPVAALLYPLAAVGEFAAVTVVLQFAGAMAVCGMRRSLYGELSKSAEAEVGMILSSALLASVLIALLLALAIWGSTMLLAFAGLVDARYFWVLWILPFISGSEVLLAGTRHYGLLRYHVLARNIAEPWTLSLLAALLSLVASSAESLLSAYLAAALAAFAVSALGLWRCLVRSGLSLALPSAREAIRLVRLSAPTAVVDMVENLYRRLDIFILGYFVTPGQVGAYFLIRQVSLLVQNVRQVLDPVVDPLISRLAVAGSMTQVQGRLELVMRWIFTFQLLLVVLLVMLGDPLLGLLGVDLEHAGAILALLLLGELLAGSSGPLELIILCLRPKLNLVCALAALAIYAPACTALSASYGALGGAAGFALGLAGLALVRGLIAKIALGIQPLPASLVKPALAGLAGLIAGSLLATAGAEFAPALTILVAGIGSLVIFGLALRLTGLEAEDREVLTRLRPGRDN